MKMKLYICIFSFYFIYVKCRQIKCTFYLINHHVLFLFFVCVNVKVNFTNCFTVTIYQYSKLGV